MDGHGAAAGRAGRETGTHGSVLTQATIVALAVRQNTVFSLAQLHELGLAGSTVRKRNGAGRIFRIYRGVYSLVPAGLLTPAGRWMAAILAWGPGAVLSHRSAAAVHGLRPTAQSAIDVTIPGRSHRRHDGIDIHRSTTLAPADTTTVNNIPVTTVARTIADLLAVAPERTAERALEQAAVMEILDGRRSAIKSAATRTARSYAGCCTVGRSVSPPRARSRSAFCSSGARPGARTPSASLSRTRTGSSG